MIHPHVTMAAMITGIVSTAIPIANNLQPVLETISHAPDTLGFLTTIFGPEGGKEVSAACGLLASACLVVAAVGRSIAPAIDNPAAPITTATEGK